MNTIEELKEYLDSTARELAEASALDKKSWYQTLLEYGNDLGEFPEDYKVPENRVRGCVSQVYIGAECREGAMYYFATSDVSTIKGFLGVIVKALNGLSPEDVPKAEQPITDFLIKTNVAQSLSPSRANAFGNTFKLITEHAQKYT